MENLSSACFPILLIVFFVFVLLALLWKPLWGSGYGRTPSGDDRLQDDPSEFDTQPIEPAKLEPSYWEQKNPQIQDWFNKYGGRGR